MKYLEYEAQLVDKMRTMIALTCAGFLAAIGGYAASDPKPDLNWLLQPGLYLLKLLFLLSVAGLVAVFLSRRRLLKRLRKAAKKLGSKNDPSNDNDLDRLANLSLSTVWAHAYNDK